MKNLLCAALIAFASTLSFAANFNVDTIRSAEGSINLSLSTVETHNAICHLEVQNLNIKLPVRSDMIGIPRPPIGLIEFDTVFNPQSFCLMAFGPHYANLELYPVQSAKEIVEEAGLVYGFYHLVVNGESEGYLYIDDINAEILEFNQIPQ